MGSGNKRKNNDVLRVNRPQQFIGTGVGLGASSGTPKDINIICPLAFNVGIKPKRALPDKTPVMVKGTEMYAIGEYIGKLSEKHLKLFAKCGGEGIHYAGRILNAGGKTYARFDQNIRG